MSDPCYIRRLFKVREQGRDVFVQTSEWWVPHWTNPATGFHEPHLEAHPEWNTEPLRSSSDLADVNERRPWDGA